MRDIDEGPAPDHYEDEAPDRLYDDDCDVLLDVPHLSVDEISLEVEDLKARVSVQADVLELLNLHVGVDAELGRVQLTVKGVEAQVVLKARLDNVARIVDRVLTTVDSNPDIVERLVEQVGGTVEEVGTAAGEALGGVGAGAGSAVGDLGRQAAPLVGGVGRQAAGAVEEVGRTVGATLGGLGLGPSARRAAPQDTETEAEPEPRPKRQAEPRPPRKTRTQSPDARPRKKSSGPRDPEDRSRDARRR